MANTLLDLTTEIQAIGPFSTTTASAGRITLWANQGQDWVNAKRKWSWLEAQQVVASVSGQASYTLIGPTAILTDADGIIDIRHNGAAAGTTFQKLRYLQQHDYDDWFAFASANTGIPVFYTLRGGAPPATTSATIPSGGFQTMEVWPAPGFIGSFKFSFFRSVASCRMTATTDVPIVPVQYHAAIIARAAMMGFNSKGMLQQAQQQQAIADSLLAEALASDTTQRTADQSAEDRPQISNRFPPQPGMASPSESPYGFGTAA